MRFETAKLIRTVLQFETVQWELIFGTKAKNRSKEFPDFIHNSSAIITLIAVAVFFLLNFSKVQLILGDYEFLALKNTNIQIYKIIFILLSIETENNKYP